ncbi:MAG: Ca-activated chloride channel, partial [Acidobacteriota bacterium]|nr:Ca-activated chloride channel [Acidobacteriota bacterium]
MRHVALALLALSIIGCSNKNDEVTTNVPPAQTKQVALQPQPNEVPPPPPPMPMSTPAMLPTGVSVQGFAAGRVRTEAADVVHNTEEYGRFDENPFLRPADDPLSTFSIDVDRASYANVRRFVQNGQRPPRDAVRIEEMVNYFTYDYPEPTSDPFSISTELAACPWNDKHRLLLIGLQGKRIKTRDLPPNNLVFLIDTSGSMQSPDKLPLVKAGLRLLIEQLRPEDRVAIVTYAGSAGLVLPSTRGSNKSAIMAAIDELEAGGSTAGAEGI